MARFEKAILSAGQYKVNGAVYDITPERLRHWADTAMRMIQSGLRIPAPWRHDEHSVPLKMGNDGTLSSSKENGGFWERFWVEEKNGTAVLYGELEAPGEITDYDSPAGRIGKTVKETSIYVRPEFEDGSGTRWKDAILHVALVTHPVEKGQLNFVPSVGFALSMALRSSPEDSLSAIIKELEEVAGIALPEDTNAETFFDRLATALRQKRIDLRNKDDEGIFKIPKKGREANPPIVAMSMTKAHYEALLKATNPQTGKPYTAEELQALGIAEPSALDDKDLENPVVKGLVKANSLLMSHINSEERRKREQRIASLVESRRITREYADKTLRPMLESFKMSFDEGGKSIPDPLDMVLDAIEQMPANPLTSKIVGGRSAASFVLPPELAKLVMSHEPEVEDGQVDDEEAEKIAKLFLANTGIKVD